MSILWKNCQALITQDEQKSTVIFHIENGAWENSAVSQMTMAEGGTGSWEEILLFRIEKIEVQANTSTWKGLTQSGSQECNMGEENLTHTNGCYQTKGGNIQIEKNAKDGNLDNNNFAGWKES